MWTLKPIWLRENNTSEYTRENIRHKSILPFKNHGLYDKRQQSWFIAHVSRGRVRCHSFTCRRDWASTRTQWSACTMYVNFQKKHDTTCSVFCEPDPFSNRVWCMWRSYLNLSKDSLFNCSPVFIFLGGPNRILHAHNTFSRKTWYKRRVKGFHWENIMQPLTFCRFGLRFFYKPITLTALSFGLIVLAYVATTQDVLEEGQDKRRVYVFSSFCLKFQLKQSYLHLSVGSMQL